MTQRLSERFLWLQWLTVGTLILSGCQPAAKPIPPVERPTNLAVSGDQPTDSSGGPAVGAAPAKLDSGATSRGSSSGQPESPPVPNPANSPAVKSSSEARKLEYLRDEAGGETWLRGQLAPPFEYWEAVYRNAQRIGVTQYKFEMADKSRLRLTMTTHMSMPDSSKSPRRTVLVETVEQPNGQMVSFSETVRIGSSETEIHGSVFGRNLRLDSQGSAGAAAKQVALPPGTWGPMGIHQLLLRNPMQPKQARAAQVFLAQNHQVALVTLTSGQPESTTCPEGLLEDVIPIDVTMQLEKEGIRVRMWADRQGNIQKTIWPQGLNFSSFRVSAETGQRMVDENEVQSRALVRVNVSDDVEQVQTLDKVVYNIGSSQPDPYQLFSSQGNQYCKSSNAFEARLTVVKSQVDGPSVLGVQQTRPEPACTRPSLFINSDDPSIQQLAVTLAADERVPGQVAIQLNEQLSTIIKAKPFDTRFLKASEVLQSQAGDPSECAVLLAALLRSREIPARIASGIRLSSSDTGAHFVYHMWTEAWVGDRWLGLDASTGRTVGCDYIKFLETPLDGPNPYRAMLPVLSVLDKLKISLVKEP